MSDINNLIQRWKDGDENAATEIYELHRNKEFYYSLRLLENVSDAEEVAQDALCHALLNIKQYDRSKCRFTTWLRIITRSYIRKKRRTNKERFWQKMFSLDGLFEKGKDIHDHIFDINSYILFDEIESAIQSLSFEKREAIILLHEGFRYREIADIQGVALGTAKSRVREGYKKLRKELGNNFHASARTLGV